MKFHFAKPRNGNKEPDSIYFVRPDKIFTLNFETNQLETAMRFQTNLTS
jgi:hypothetical protein